jgi:hypothetical protein
MGGNSIAEREIRIRRDAQDDEIGRSGQVFGRCRDETRHLALQLFRPGGISACRKQPYLRRVRPGGAQQCRA